MKKTMIFAAVAAIFMFSSCQKEELTPVQDSQSEELVFTATIDQSATKTTINTDGSDADHMLTIEGQSSLYALSKDEWSYLFDSRTSGLYKSGVTVTNGGTSYTNCLIIAPDAFTGTLKASYTLDEVNASGLVCLPATGYRDGSSLDCGGFSGDYWSATPLGYIEDSVYGAYSQYFDNEYVFLSDASYRNYGVSVRLVCSVSAE